LAFRILFELALLLSPFLIFGLYRMAISEAEAEGRKPWPVTMLFAVGFALAAFAWMVLIVLDKRNTQDGVCYGPSKVVNGEVVRGDPYPCEKDVSRIGVPDSSDPGGVAEGVYNPDQPLARAPHSVGDQRTPQDTPPAADDKPTEPIEADDPDE